MSSPATHIEALRPLVHGERVSPEDFDARYEITPGSAELYGGRVRLRGAYVGSPTSLEHEKHASIVQTWLGVYAAHRADVAYVGSPTTHLPNGSRVEPDALLRRLGPDAATREEGKGRSSRLVGAPELVVEVGLSTLEDDLDDTEGKRATYREAGVREYLVVNPAMHAVHWWHLDISSEPAEWVALQPDEHGVLASSEFPGLRLHVEALLTLDVARVLSVLAG